MDSCDMQNNSKLTHELDFWSKERYQYLKWYNGQLKDLYYAKPPQEHQKITRFDNDLDNALYTWTRADWNRYLRHLMLDEFFFEEKSVLDVGGGPLGLSRAFVGAYCYVVDPLVTEYERTGYPLVNQDVTYICKNIEEISESHNNYFDAVISVNAIDHVDDFEQAIKAIERVVKPDGIIRIEMHYHQPTPTEPMVLNHERVANAFSDKFKMKCISDVPFRTFYPGYNDPSERLALWSNTNYIVDFDPLPHWSL